MERSQMTDNNAYEHNRDLFFNAVNGNRITIIKKPREAGLTTFLSEYAMKNDDQQILYLTYKLDLAKEFLDKCKKINKDVSHIKITSLSVSNILKYNLDSFNILIIEECAFIKNDILLQLKLHKFNKVIIGSTPNGSNGYFYDLFNNVSISGINLRTPFNLNDPDVIDKLCEKYDTEKSFKEQILGQFYSEKDKVETVNLNNVKIEKLLYLMMIERIRQIDELTHNTYTLTLSDYIREVIKADIKDNILVDLFFRED